MENEVRRLVKRFGPEAALDKAKEMREDGKLSQEAYELIARQTRLN